LGQLVLLPEEAAEQQASEAQQQANEAQRRAEETEAMLAKYRERFGDL